MKNIRIVPAEASDDGYQHSNYTKVFSGDAEICGIKTIDVHYAVDELVTATVEIFSTMDPVCAAATFMVSNPNTGTLSKVKFIEFEDGSQWHAGRDG